MKATYELKVKSDSDTDIQPTVASLESPLVDSIEGIDTDRVRVELVDGADAAAYESLMDSDDDVFEYRRAEGRAINGQNGVGNGYDVIVRRSGHNEFVATVTELSTGRTGTAHGFVDDDETLDGIARAIASAPADAEIEWEEAEE